MKKTILLPLISIALAAGILFGMSYALYGVAMQNAQDEHIQIMQTVLPDSKTFEIEPYSGDDANIRSVHKADNGFVIETAGKGKQSLKVQNYKKYFYDLSKIDSKNIIQTDIPSQTKTEAILSMMTNPEYFKIFSKENLIQLVKNHATSNENEQMQICVENAKNELIRRGFDLAEILK